MLILITGGSGSGKSAYAEKCMNQIFQGCRKYYIATMQVSDMEGQAKVERHRRMRRGKGFYTIEQPVSIEAALKKMRWSESEVKLKQQPFIRTALLECISNLTANEMFTGGTVKDSDTVSEKIIQGIKQLNEGLEHFVIVTNNVFEDGVIYDKTTMKYIRTMGRINKELAAMADEVIEVVVGIPVIVKEREGLLKCE